MLYRIGNSWHACIVAGSHTAHSPCRSGHCRARVFIGFPCPWCGGGKAGARLKQRRSAWQLRFVFGPFACFNRAFGRHRGQPFWHAIYFLVQHHNGFYRVFAGTWHLHTAQENGVGLGYVLATMVNNIQKKVPNVCAAIKLCFNL